MMPDFTAEYSAVVLATPGLISYWRLGEKSGSALDSNVLNHGIIHGALTRDVKGLLAGDVDGAVQSDGAVGKYIEVPPPTTGLDTPAATVECWVRPTARPAGDVSIVDRFSTDSWLLTYDSSGRFRWYVRPQNLSADFSYTSVASPVGVRRHLVGTYSAADGLRFYIDGVQVGAVAGTGQPIRVIYPVDSPLFFFTRYASAPTFPGVIDEVAIYDRVLTLAQVQQHYHTGVTLPISRADIFGDTLYEGLEPVAVDDAALGHPLQTFSRALGRTFAEVENYARDQNGDPGWSIAMDVDRIPRNGLPWLAQFAGVRVPVGTGDAASRQYIKDRPYSRRGTPAAIILAAQAHLTGLKRVTITERDSSPYHFLVNVKTADAPASEVGGATFKIRDDIIAAKPAGLQFTLAFVP